METYAPGQLRRVTRWIGRRPPTWFIIGGPADGDEAQTARTLWPDIRILGVEPVNKFIEWQRENGWSSADPLIYAALWTEAGDVTLTIPDDPRRSSVTRAVVGVPVVVPAVTLDALDDLYGPFRGSFLWLDIEGGEAYALEGASRLLSRPAREGIRYVNLEIISGEPGDWTCRRILRAAGFRKVGYWGVRECGRIVDEFWVRRA